MPDTCPFCAIKHLLSAKTFLIEARTAGFNPPITTDDIDEVVDELDRFIVEKNLRPSS